MRKEKSRSPPKLSNGRLLLILACLLTTCKNTDSQILLMYFFLGMSDTEIGDRLKINRSTSFRSRKNSLEELKKKLKENMNDE